MKFFQTKKLIVALLLWFPLSLFSVQSAQSTEFIPQTSTKNPVIKKKKKKKLVTNQIKKNDVTNQKITPGLHSVDQKNTEKSADHTTQVPVKIDANNITVDAKDKNPMQATGPAQASMQSVKATGKIVKEVYANRNMIYLNSANPYDRSFRYRTTADGILVTTYGDNKKNPMLDAKIAVRFRYDGGTDALVRTASTPVTLAGAPLVIPGSSIQKSTLWLRELFMKISLDHNPTESLYYLKFGSFPYELGRGIALGSAYNSGGFLGLDPRFSIDQFAPGGLLHADIVKGTLSGDLYYAMLSNPNASFKENTEVIRLNELTEYPSKGYRGLNRQVWITAGALHWKAINLKDLKLNVDPYAYMFVSPDQNLEFAADSDSQLYAIGTALEFKTGKFEWGFDTAFQGGQTRVKAWDRNYTKLVNDDGTVTVQYTKVYTDADFTILANATTDNQDVIAAAPKGFDQNGLEIGTSGLYNGPDRFRPTQKFFYHGYFFVTDASYELIKRQLKICADTGFVSGHLDNFNDINSFTQAQMEHQNFDGFIPLQSVYSGKRIQHLVMLNTGVPRFTVQNPAVSLDQQHVASRITGVATLTDKFTNLAYTGLGLECTPTKFADQKAMIKPVALYYWMAQAPNLADGTIASHALGTALSVEFMATIKECLDMGGYVGWMIPGKQYQQFAGTQLKGGKLGSDTAYVLNFTMTYKF
jgi:hypothetical protein